MSVDQASKQWSKVAEKRDPFLTKLTAIDMDKYLLAVHEWVLNHKPSIQDWVRGKIPLVMLEFEQTRANRNLLGLSIALNILPDGSSPGVNVTANDLRKRIINSMMKEDQASAVSASSAKAVTVTEQTILEELFPARSTRGRESERSSLHSDVEALMGLMLFSWPSKEIRVKLQANQKVMSSFDCKDLILFFQELREFSLQGSGNIESNREAAELYLVGLKMREGKVIEYVNAFTAAVRHVRICKSTFTEGKIVDLVFRNLDQELFPAWYSKFLNKDDSLYRFKEVKIEVALDHILDYYTQVIRVMDLSLQGNKHDSKDFNNAANNSKTIKSIKQLQSAINNKTPDGGATIQVTHAVLATFLKRKGDPSSTDPPSKRAKAAAEAEVIAKPVKKPCYVYAKGDSCKFGDKCRFSHDKK
jgi:hypothetical protein